MYLLLICFIYFVWLSLKNIVKIIKSFLKISYIYILTKRLKYFRLVLVVYFFEDLGVKY